MEFIHRFDHRLTRITFVAALIIAGFLVAPPKAHSAGTDITGKVWVLTPAAQERTLLGDCPTGYVCKELCMFVNGNDVGMGDFRCFPTS